MTNFSFNPNRSGSKGALQLEQKIMACRNAVKALVNNDNALNVVFSQNCTTALNLGILGHAKRGGHVVSTTTEHNSVLRPLMELKSRGIVDVTLIKPNADGSVSVENLLKALKSNTYMVALSHASNVTGSCQNLSALFSAVKGQRGDILTLADCAQTAGYAPIDMNRWGVDLVAFPAHKGLHGLQGVGVLAFNNNSRPQPIVYGGTGTESQNLQQPLTSPDGLEAGTLNCPAIVALNAAIVYFAENHKEHCEKIARLNGLMIEGLRQIPKVTVYSQPNASGIAAFNIAHYDSAVVGDFFTQKDVAVRTGLHCAPLMHKWLNTFETGAIRASLAYDNTEIEVYTFLNMVNDVAKSV
jgi:selenocysteine lyase/cysteine desulfurase